MSSPVLLVLGAGPNVGLAVARKFAKQGYRVALAARNPNDELSKAADLVLKADFSEPSAVVSIFDKVKEKLGIPTVVVYNAYSVHLTPEDPFSISVTDFNTDMVVNTTSAFAAAQEATRGFDQLPADASKTFIFTGNNLNIPGRLLLVATSSGMGKSATAHFIANAASANLGKGYKYYYADERTPEGETVKFDNSGEAHGEFYYDLAQDLKQGPWLATFVKGKGYVDFSATDREYR